MHRSARFSSLAFFVIILFFYMLFFRGSAVAADRGITAKPVASPSVFKGYDTDTFYALIIGIDTYEALPPLRTAVRDADAIATLLQEKFSFKKDNIKLLKNREANRSGILEVLTRYRNSLTEKDSLLIYYAGHGRLEDNNPRLGYWVPVDGLENTVAADISHTLLRKNYLELLKVKHLLVFSDSCFGGALAHRNASTPTFSPPYSLHNLSKSFAKPSRWIIASGDQLETVPDDAGNGHSPFCTRILQFFNSEEKPFDVDDLFYYLKKSLVRTDPIKESLKTETHQPGGSFVFVPSSFKIPSSSNTPEDSFSDAFAHLVDESEPNDSETMAPVPTGSSISSGQPQDTNYFIIKNPDAGIMHFGGHQYNLQSGPKLELAKGTYPFSLQLEGGKHTIYGKFEVLIVDEETVNATFGLDSPLFKENHIVAALKGSPVQYSIGLLSEGKQKEVARYFLSLRKIH